MKVKNTKFGEELTCNFKIGIRNLTNFDLSTRKSQNFSFNRLLLSKVYIVWGKKSTDELSFMKLKWDVKFGEESTYGFKTDIRKFDKFWPKHSKVSKIFTLIGSFWTKYKLFEVKKRRKVIFHENEEGCKIWRAIDLLFQNGQKEFDEFWPKHSRVLDIFTLIGSFWAKYIYCLR